MKSLLPYQPGGDGPAHAAAVHCSAAQGGYTGAASRDVPSALRATSLSWLVSMPVVLAQLILITALESRWARGGAGGTRGPGARAGCTPAP